MSSQLTNSRYCGGNVKPARFVTQDTVQGRVVQSTDGSGSHGDKVYGISDLGTWQPPLAVPPSGTNALDDGYAGIVGSPPINIYRDGAECYILSGASFSIDDELKADSDGRGITASAASDNIGAVALEAATAANQLKKVCVKTRRVHE